MDFDSFFTHICKKLEESCNVKETSDQFSCCTSNVERVSFVSNLEAVSSYIEELVSYLKTDGSSQKSRDLAVTFRTEGNQWFQKKNCFKAIKCYSQSIFAAPSSEGNELSLAFANRSAVFQDLKEWIYCLRDIDLAFQKGYPLELRHKLYERKGNCLLKLGKKSLALKSYNKAKEYLQLYNIHQDKLLKMLMNIQSKIDSITDFKSTKQEVELSVEEIEENSRNTRNVAPELNKLKNPLLPCASMSVKIGFSTEQGRHLIATEDLEPGTTIIVEKAFSSILFSDYKETHCHHCLHWTSAPVPCHSCSKVGFCSSHCQNEAWKCYHASECGLAEFLNRSNVGSHGLLAFRTVSKVGIEKLESVLTKPSSTDSSTSPESVLYDVSDYSTVFHLITNTDRRSVADLFRRTLMAVYLASAWRFRHPEAPECRWRSIAAVFLQHLQNFPCNVHEIAQLRFPAGSADATPVGRAHLNQIGAAALACLSLINHSCDPNVVRHCYGDLVVVTVIRRIRTGQQILDNYGYHYATHPAPERTAQLRKQYYFDCGCQACSGQWPLFEQIPESPRPEDTAAFHQDLDRFMQFSCRTETARLEEMTHTFARHICRMDSGEGGQLFRQFNGAQEALKQCLALRASVYFELE